MKIQYDEDELERIRMLSIRLHMARWEFERKYLDPVLAEATRLGPEALWELGELMESQKFRFWFDCPTDMEPEAMANECLFPGYAFEARVRARRQEKNRGS